MSWLHIYRRRTENESRTHGAACVCRTGHEVASSRAAGHATVTATPCIPYIYTFSDLETPHVTYATLTLTHISRQRHFPALMWNEVTTFGRHDNEAPRLEPYWICSAFRLSFFLLQADYPPGVQVFHHAEHIHTHTHTHIHHFPMQIQYLIPICHV
jgi:hypothetical protein